MKKIKMLIMGAAMAVAGVAMATAPAMAATCPEGTQWAGETIGGDNIKSIAQCNMPKDNTAAPTNDLWKTIQTIIDWILAILGLIAVIMIIIGGVTYMTSQGDPTKTKRGKDTILYGIIGLIIALLAYAIVNFVLANIFGNNTGTTGSTNNNGAVTNTYTVTTGN